MEERRTKGGGGGGVCVGGQPKKERHTASKQRVAEVCHFFGGPFSYVF